MDQADIATDVTQERLDQQIQAHRRPLEPGEPGDCRECGDHSARLVRGVCAPCRDMPGENV